MSHKISPFKDLNKAHSVLKSCVQPPHLEAAITFFELVLQKWGNTITPDHQKALKAEFFEGLTHKKAQLQIE